MPVLRPLVLAACAVAVVGCSGRSRPAASAVAPVPAPAPSAAQDAVAQVMRVEGVAGVTAQTGARQEPRRLALAHGSATTAALPPLPEHLDASTTPEQLVIHAGLTANSEAAAGLFDAEHADLRQVLIAAHWRPLLAERIATRAAAARVQAAWRDLAQREAVLRSQHRAAVERLEAEWDGRIQAVERSVLPVDNPAVRSALAPRPYRRPPGLGSCWNSLQQ